MLAGPRKKQKISADPRNKRWIEDPNQFGRKLMEKMGWSDGKGLGTNEDGEKDFVKVSVKDNSKGLGYTRNEEENWISHQDDFNDLLSQLHQEHSTSNDDVETEAQAPKSIEERSKKSKKRVHYKKFTSGKDLANRSIDDMNCIFGKRSGSSTPQNLSAPTSDNESEDRGVKTITNTVSMQDYFAQKMLERKLGSKVSSDQAKEIEQDESSVKPEEAERDEEEEKHVTKKKKSKRKKKNKRKLDHDGREEIERRGDNVGGDGDWRGGDSVGFVGFKNAKTSKEDGPEGKVEVTVEEEEDEEVRDGTNEEMRKKKKQKKSRNLRKQKENKVEEEG